VVVIESEKKPGDVKILREQKKWRSRVECAVLNVRVRIEKATSVPPVCSFV